MAKRGYKLQEFVAHSGNVNCLRIAKKSCRQFITGGDDQQVNLWSIGKPTCSASLSGHSSPVESVAFDSSEVLVAAGASSGVIKLWDLEETKMVRTLTGHRSYCTALEFHPFGEFFASGSMDTNLKVWDIRKKGCIHTYKGHTRGITNIRFTPDGRWVVSGGFDNIVKVWDLTAGKLLHDFKFHEGHIRSLDFHPLEFLLATGSADRTVKFWDLETFEMIGSARREAKGVRSITFHPDGKTLFCGLDDSLKVYSWEPVICHDSVDMGWSTISDLCIYDGKLLGGSYFENSVGVWVADISLLEPYGAASAVDQISPLEQKSELQESSLDKEVREEQSKSKKYETQEDTVDKEVRHESTRSSLRCTSPDIEPKDIKNIYVDTAGENPVVPQIVSSLSSPKFVLPADTKKDRQDSDLRNQKQGSSGGLHAKRNGASGNKSFVVPCVVSRDSSDGKGLISSRNASVITAKVKPSHVRRLSNNKFDMERMSTALESRSFGNVTRVVETGKDTKLQSRITVDNNAKESSEEGQTIKSSPEKLEKSSASITQSNQENCQEPLDNTRRANSVKVVNGVAVVQGRTRSLVQRFEKREGTRNDESHTPDTSLPPTSEAIRTPTLSKHNPKIVGREESAADSNNARGCQMEESAFSDCNVNRQEKSMLTDYNVTNTGRPRLESSANNYPVTTHQKEEPIVNTYNAAGHEREDSAADDNNVIQSLMQNHDILLSTFRSRLTKLQVVRHFWERKDVKGAINALRKLPDHSVQADVISVLIERMEIITLDLFSCLLPVLSGLLDSKIERHANISLEILLKLVAVFGSVVRSTVSAPPGVGVDLHAEQRRECCKQCFVHLQNIHKTLPLLVRRGGSLAKSAQELNLVLQEP